MEHADDDLDLHQPIEWQPEVEAFSNFVMLVVPKLGQETAKWKYDVRPDEKRLTIYTLSYEYERVAVNTCLSLHFRSEPPDASCAYSLTPTFSWEGNKPSGALHTQSMFGRTFLTSPVEVQTLLQRLDQDRSERDAAPCLSPKKAENEGVAHEAFSEFTKQIVPQSGQETSAWKYDVQQTGRRITVFRLAYANHLAEIADCLSLHFFPSPSDLYVHIFLPLVSAEGKRIDASVVQNALGKDIVTTPGDVQSILRHLERADTDDAAGGRLGREERESSVDSLDEWIAEYEEDPEEQEMAVIAGNEPASKKRRLEEEANGSSFKKRVKAIEEVVVPEEEDEALFEKMHLRNTLRLNVNTIPSLPVHKNSGGTILSSQYWRNQRRSREKLNCTMDIYMSNEAMESLPNLSEDVHESKEYLADSATYAWMLLEHLLGGKEAISRTFAYISSGTCPIERKETVRIVVKLCDAVVEHMERSFSLAKKEVLIIRTKVLSMLLPIVNTPYNHMRGYNGRARFPSDESLRQLLKGSSYPERGKVQIAHGFDFYMDEEMLKLSGELYKEDDEKLTVVSRWGRFAMDIVAELVGGIEALNRVQEETAGKMLALIGEDVFEAIWKRAQNTFGKKAGPPLTDFRVFVGDFTRLKKNGYGVKVNVTSNRTLMASVLFQPSAALVCGMDGPPAVPGCNYWTSPAPHRTRLSPSSNFYMQTVRLAEYQRYLGLERGKTISLYANRDYAPYLRALSAYAVGGDEYLLKHLLERRKGKPTAKLTALLEQGLIPAILDHVERLFELQLPTSEPHRHLYDCVELYCANLLRPYDKGETRWYFAELDERPKPEAVALLEAQEYWRKPAPDRTQLRPGHDVYIRTKVLKSIESYYGPGSKEACIKKYSSALIIHMLGGPEAAFKLKQGNRSVRKLRSLFVFEDLLALCLHSDEVFHLAFSIAPDGSLTYANARISRCNSDRKYVYVATRPGRKVELDSLPLALDPE